MLLYWEILPVYDAWQRSALLLAKEPQARSEIWENQGKSVVKDGIELQYWKRCLLLLLPRSCQRRFSFHFTVIPRCDAIVHDLSCITSGGVFPDLEIRQY